MKTAIVLMIPESACAVALDAAEVRAEELTQELSPTYRVVGIHTRGVTPEWMLDDLFAAMPAQFFLVRHQMETGLTEVIPRRRKRVTRRTPEESFLAMRGESGEEASLIGCGVSDDGVITPS